MQNSARISIIYRIRKKGFPPYAVYIYHYPYHYIYVSAFTIAKSKKGATWTCAELSAIEDMIKMAFTLGS